MRWLVLVWVWRVVAPWQCPEVRQASCSCDLPHTLRCTGGRASLTLIADKLRALTADAAVSLLDCSLQNLTALSGPLLQGVTLHGLVISSGEVRQVSKDAFTGLASPLQALGLPNNLLEDVPTSALAALTSLQRLDLSHNRIHRIDNTSFEGPSLTFLDLSDNILALLSPESFTRLAVLRVLRLQRNRLAVSAVASLLGLLALEELDLSGNSLGGPLGPATLPRLPTLATLTLAHNQLSSVTRGALAGLDSIHTLSLRHNQIDVLEDHAFRALPTLTRLDLAHNRMVAVSGASLAHLTRLSSLDVSHNFLRALTPDLILPLKLLTQLRLDDNDISMVASDALTSNAQLKQLTLAENPLNCDCSLSDFASWLRNSSLTAEDKATAVCATPPALENGLVEEISPDELVCGDGPALLDGPLPTPMPVSGTRVILRAFHYDGVRISLLWSVDATELSYSCDALFVYEELGVHEVLLESNPLKCDSTRLVDPRTLSLVLSAQDLQAGHRYRYCVVLLEGGGSMSDDSALVLGCSEVIPLTPTVKPQPQPNQSGTRMIDVDANLTSTGTLTITAHLWNEGKNPNCIVVITIYSAGSMVVQKHLNCSHPFATFTNLPASPYRVCASLGDFPPAPSCITVSQPDTPQHSLSAVLSIVLIVLGLLLVLLMYHTLRRFFKRPEPHHQCFLPVAQAEEQHARYVKLQATTKV